MEIPNFRSRLTYCAVPALLAAWRVGRVPPGQLWRDWLFILSIFWVYSLVAPEKNSRTMVAISIMAYLLGIYAFGQVAHAPSILGLAQ